MILPFSNNNLYFKPGIFLTVIFASMIVVFYSLGIWQLERADEKKILAKVIKQRLSQANLVINKTSAELIKRTDLAHRTLEIKGKFETQDQFFVDNKKHNGQAGYHVVTPFKIENTQQRILVNRGWISAGNNRQILPEVTTPSEIISLRGRVSEPVTAKFRPGISQPADALGGVWLYIDLNFFNNLSAKPVASYILLLNKENPYGYVREWPEFKANTEMHVGYALQWFAFSFFSLLAYLAIGIKKHE